MSEAVAALVGAIVGSGIVVVREWLASSADSRKRAKYLAVRVVITLDRFVDQCAVVSLDDGYLEGNRDEATATTEAPSPISFPDDVDWRSIDHQLAYDLLSLDNKLHDAQQAINAAAAVGDDRLTQGTVRPENFTHGTSAQRVQWFRIGAQSGDVNQCDTFNRKAG